MTVGANQSHGLRRTNDDKRRAVMTLLNDEEWGGWSANEISKRCGVSQPFVSQIKSSLITVISEDGANAGACTYTTKHGTTAVMNTANIGRMAVENDCLRTLCPPSYCQKCLIYRHIF
jgi:hypothetical protein